MTTAEITVSAAKAPNGSVDRARPHRPHWLHWRVLLLLVVIVSGVWCAASNRWSVEAWRTPSLYAGDGWWGLAVTKVFSDGEIPLVLPKYPSSLGAPFRANWNDFATVEEGTHAWCNLLAYWFGIFSSQHAIGLSAHLLAAISFYVVCRYLRYDAVISAAAAVLFAFSRYASARGISHFSLIFYWHIPLGFLVVWWCVARTSFTFKKLLVGVVAAFAFATQNPYYTGMFVQFSFGAAFICLLQRRSWPRVLIPLGLCTVTMFGFCLMNADTFHNDRVNGPNDKALHREYRELEYYALRPLELLVPAGHRLAAVERWATNAYYNRTMLRGEPGSPYLGIVGIGGLALLGYHVVRAVAARAKTVPTHFWYISWILGYSVVGGLNGIIGLLGVVQFRGANRYSIFILCLLLMFLAREVSRWTRNWRRPAVIALAAAISVLGLWDQLAPFTTTAEIKAVAALVESDRQFTSRLESKLPPGAMIFQMPVMEFPETAAVGKVADYELFRPYLHSSGLRFSYGNVKGRTRERWQIEAERLGAPGLVPLLERYGFSAILIARKGYPDAAQSLLGSLSAAGRSATLVESAEFVAVALNPSAAPALPPEFDNGWHALEGTPEANWRWSSGDAAIVFHSNATDAKPVQVTFGVSAIKPSRVDIFLGPERLASVAADSAQSTVGVELNFLLNPGKSFVRFHTNVRGEVPGPGDQRKLAFRIIDFRMVE